MVFSVPRTPSRVHFNCLDDKDSKAEVRYMALETSFQPSLDEVPNLPKLPTPLGKPQIEWQTHWTHTSCSLLGVSEIRPCLRRFTDETHVTGILVCYVNGHRECVGQYRPDWAVEPMSLLDKSSLFIQFPRTRLNKIFAISTHAPCEIDGVGWTAIPIAGTLEWWFAIGSLKLYQDGKEIKVPEID